MLLLGQPKSGLADPKPISIDSKKWRIIGFEFLAHFALLGLTSTLISGGLQWIWQTWFVEWVFSILLFIVRPTQVHFLIDSRSPT